MEQTPSDLASQKWFRRLLLGIGASLLLILIAAGLVRPLVQRWQAVKQLRQLNAGMHLYDGDSEFESTLSLYGVGPHSIELGDSGIRDDQLAAVSSFPYLQRVSLCRNPITNSGLAQLRNLPLLELSLDETRVGTGASTVDAAEAVAGFSSIGTLTELSILSLKKTQVCDADLEVLTHLRKLTSLNLSETCVTDAGLRHLASCSDLAQLLATGTKINGTGLRELPSSLLFLDLSGSELNDTGIAEIGQLPELKVMHLNDTKVTSIGFAQLMVARQLELISGERCQLTDDIWKTVRTIPKLKSLRLDGTEVTLKGIGDDPFPGELTALSLADCGVDDNGVAQLAILPSLQYLNLKGTKITDRAMAGLATLPRLSCLNLRRCRLTDEGLDSIAKCQKLSLLNLSATSVTTAGLRKLAVIPELSTLVIDPKLISKSELPDVFREFPSLGAVYYGADSDLQIPEALRKVRNSHGVPIRIQAAFHFYLK